MMKKFLFKAAAACAVFGVVLCIIGAVAGGKLTGVRIGWKDGEPQVEYHSTDVQELLTGVKPILGSAKGETDGKYTVFDGEEIHSLEIDLGGAEVYLEAADRWSVTTQNDLLCTAQVKNGVLHIKNIGEIETTGTVCTITYPQTAQLRSLDVSLGGGSLQNLGTLVCNELELELGAGSILLNGITVQDECSVDVGIGGVELNGSLARGAEIDCGMGSVVCRLAPVDAYDYRVECGMGSVVLDDSEFSGMGAQDQRSSGAPIRYEIECGMGSVELTHGA